MANPEPKEKNKKIAEEIYSAMAQDPETLLLSTHLKMLISEALDIQAERYEKRIAELVKALKKIKCQNGFFPDCYSVEPDKGRKPEPVGTDIIEPCERCQALFKLERKESRHDRH